MRQISCYNLDWLLLEYEETTRATPTRRGEVMIPGVTEGDALTEVDSDCECEGVMEPDCEVETAYPISPST